MLEIRHRVLAAVDPPVFVGEFVVVFDAHAVAVDQLHERVFLGEAVQVGIIDQAVEKVSGGFGHGVEVGRGFRGVLLGGGAGFLVLLPVGFLAGARAVGLRVALGALLEGDGE